VVTVDSGVVGVHRVVDGYFDSSSSGVTYYRELPLWLVIHLLFVISSAPETPG